MAILEHFLFDSDYSADKIAFADSGYYASPGSTGVKYSFINTHIPTILYAEGDYKVDGSNQVRATVRRGLSPNLVLRTFMYNGECWIALVSVYNQDDLGKGINYRIWAYYNEKDAKNVDIPPTSNVTGRKLIFDSDQNYPRFIQDGYLTLGDSFTHGVGYIPYTKTWQHYQQETMPGPSGGDITLDYYTQTQTAFFGNPSNTDYASGVVQVTDSTITTFAGYFPMEADGVYFRLYQI